MVEKFMPDIYQKSIYYINYDKLYKKGIRYLLFDLDNTITPSHVNKPTKRLKKLFDELKDKGFKIIIMSNATKHRINPFKNDLAVDACAFSLKPKKDKYERIMERFKCKHTEVAAIGDQLITDIMGANIFKAYPILVDPMAKKDLKISYFNRMLEKKVFKKYAKKGIMKKGEYYD